MRINEEYLSSREVLSTKVDVVLFFLKNKSLWFFSLSYKSLPEERTPWVVLMLSSQNFTGCFGAV